MPDSASPTEAGYDRRTDMEHRPEADSPVFVRSIVVLLALATFINFLDRGSLATAAPLIKDELKLTNTEFGMLISAFFWIYVPGQLLAAWLIARINAYRTLVVGLIIWSLATLAMGFAAGFGALLLLRILLGLGESAAFPASSKMLAQNLPLQRLGFANALLSAGIMLGPAVGTFAGGLLIAHAGWRSLFFVFGTLSLAWLVPWMLITGRSMRQQSRVPHSATEITFRHVMRRGELWAASMGHFANNYSSHLVMSWLPLYLVKAQGYSLTEMAKLAGVVYVLAAGFGLAAGFLADRWMSAGAGPNKVRKTMMGAACVIAIICMLMCGFGSPRVILAGLLLSSVGYGLGGFNLYAIGQTLAGPSAAGKWIGIQNCIGNMAGIVAPIATGAIVDATGYFNAAFIVSAFVSAVGLYCWTVGIRRVEPIRWE